MEEKANKTNLFEGVNNSDLDTSSIGSSIPEAIAIDLLLTQNHIPECSCNKYCQETCELYHHCYANHTYCAIQVFEDIWNNSKLQPWEILMTKLSYGFHGNKLYTDDELSNMFKIPVENICATKSKVLRRLRHPQRARHLRPLMDLNTLDNSYGRLLADLFGAPNAFRKFVETQGVDLSIVEFDKNSERNPNEIRKELDADIGNLHFLELYKHHLKEMGITSLRHLLHISPKKLIAEMGAMSFQLFDTISNQGYKIKSYDTEIQQLRESWINTIQNSITDYPTYDVNLSELPLGILSELWNCDTTTVEQLLDKLAAKKIDLNHVDNAHKTIDSFLERHNLIFYSYSTLYESKFYITSNFFIELFSYLKDQPVEILFTLQNEVITLPSQTLNSFWNILRNKYGKIYDGWLYYISNHGWSRTSLESLDLSVRAFHCLKRAGYNTVEDLTTTTEEKLVMVRNLGAKCVQEVKEKLSQRGLSLSISEE